MKKLINIFLSAVVVMAVQSCTSDTELSKTLDGTTSGTALRGLVETNNFDISDLSTTWSILLEIDDEEFGDATQEIRVLIGFTDDGGANSVTPALFETIPRSNFTVQNSQTTHDLPEGTVSYALSDMIAFLGLATTDYDRDDVININFEAVRTDGRVFNNANVGSNTGSSGAFSFFKSQFNYTPIIDDPNRVLLTGNSVENLSVRGGAADSVFLTFDAALVTLPTITPISAAGSGLGTVGALTQIDGGEYFFFYTPDGTAPVDTIGFAVSGGASVAGFTMVDQTASNLYLVDNVVPVASNTSSSLSLTGSNIGTISLDFIFSEELFGEVTYTITSAQFDTVTLTTEEEEAEEASVSFTPKVGDASLAAGDITFQVVVSGAAGTDGVDVGGNPVGGTFAISLF